jgi:microcystin-dependent protein
MIREIAEIKRTIANYKGFANQSFPLECDGLNDSQLNSYLLSILGNIGGDKYILAGCTAATGYKGYVFLGTNKFPAGELLYVEPATAVMGYLCVREVNETVNADGYTYTNAYAKRTLYFGVPSGGVESYDFADFAQIKTNKELQTLVAELDTTVRNFSPESVGSMKFWPSLTLPANWMQCDGSFLLKSEYPMLFTIIGTTFGSRGADEFALPNVGGMFPVAFKNNDTDFGEIGKTGGEKAVGLTDPAQMPRHTHIQRVSPETGVYPKKPGYKIATDPPTTPENAVAANNDNVGIVDWLSSNGGSGDGDNYVHTKWAGDGATHNNIPPYFALPFIIKVK